MVDRKIIGRTRIERKGGANAAALLQVDETPPLIVRIEREVRWRHPAVSFLQLFHGVITISAENPESRPARGKALRASVAYPRPVAKRAMTTTISTCMMPCKATALT